MKNDNLKDELTQILKQENKWVKVHAAEFLIWEGLNRDTVYDIYKKIEEPIYENEPPYRIGVWRVLYQSAVSEEEKKSYVQKIVHAYDEKVDTLHIIETLAKLKVPFSAYNEAFKKSILTSDNIDPFTIYGLWNLYADQSVDQNILFDKLYNILINKSVEDNIKIVISYVFRYVPFDEQQWSKLTQSLSLIQSVAVQKQLLVSLLQRSAVIDANYIDWRNKLQSLCTTYSDNTLLLSALCHHKDDSNLAQLTSSYEMLSDKADERYNADWHATAAYAMMKIAKK